MDTKREKPTFGRSGIYLEHELSDKYRLLLAGIMSRAFQDLKGRNKRNRWSAANYFLGGLYTEHLDWLDICIDSLPEGFTKKDLHEIIKEGY